MPKLKPETILPTPEEDAAITAAAMSDPDAIPYTDTEWEAVKPVLTPPCATGPRPIPPHSLRMNRYSHNNTPCRIKKPSNSTIRHSIEAPT